MKWAYYNEIDPFCAQWLRNLMREGLIMEGEVDERSIQDVAAADVDGYIQCHFFAGIGGWAYALQLAQWPEDRSVWTGSCPCQPFSAAGKQAAQSDPRHLLPDWVRLIERHHPPVIFGEQVDAAIAHGWLDELVNELEAEDYSIGSAVLPACSVGTPHRRNRLWFVAESSQQLSHPRNIRESGWEESTDSGSVGDSDKPGSQRRQLHTKRTGEWSSWQTGLEWIECPDGKHRPIKPGIRLLANGIPGRVGRLRAGGNAVVPQVAAEFIAAYMEI